ncbi:MAG: bifunctional (p)ppGpp synthetase/guanosine-3',5'-bis(diphosphate) 3'-pyrophosphohydrolase, partial [Eubacterium sp.]|nr:bifunctional (p)ppGpp synthetase/guanosine-3',5'-bis(diphosphate) 3'-pyrophosphohydrolase [Eubacterium sp.]
MTVEEAEVKTETAENTVNGAEQEKSEPQPISIVYDVYGRKRAGDLQTPADFTPPETLYRELIEKIKLYHPSEDFSMIEKAYKLADEAHNGQKRKSGEPYIIHPICVGIILAELKMDKETIVAGLLHDVIEDTVVTKEELAREFSEEIALLVDGVTKLTKLNLSQDKIELQAENLRKMFLAMAQDIRVIIIKLADRLHNLRTLQYQSHEKQIEKARETMDIYSPIAHRLGISKIKIELDDLSMQYLYPEVYMDLRTKIDERLTEREEFINEMVAEVRDYIKEAGIKAEIDGRVKHLFSIFKKMKTQDKTLDQIFDIFALRIKVDTVRDCYAALGIIHEKYKPIPGRFKDYIAMPKANMYQSLHTTLIGHGGRPFEIQIRTYEMHRTAEYGIAAHWKYKESGSTNVNKEEEKLNWLRKILEWQNDTADNREFMNVVKTDLDIFQDQVYCFTPDGDVKTLPAGSTPIDFAYVVHTAVGNRMVGARVNGRQVPIEYKLKSGDRVEIITSQNSRGPSMDWLNIVQSTQARTKINQ